MAIRTKERAKVSPEFIDAYRELAEAKLRNFQATIEATNITYRKAMVNKYKAALVRLAPIVKGQSGAGVGMDFEISRLRSLDFERLERKGDFLIGYTHDPLIIEEIDRGSKTVAKWDAGQFAVCVPLSAFKDAALSHIHFIPQRATGIGPRHPHHYSYGDAGPLTSRVATCWSEFATPLTAAVDDVDIVESFRLLRIFVGRYYNGSPLRSPAGNPEMSRFMWRVQV